MMLTETQGRDHNVLNMTSELRTLRQACESAKTFKIDPDWDDFEQKFLQRIVSNRIVHRDRLESPRISECEISRATHSGTSSEYLIDEAQGERVFPNHVTHDHTRDFRRYTRNWRISHNTNRRFEDLSVQIFMEWSSQAYFTNMYAMLA